MTKVTHGRENDYTYEKLRLPTRPGKPRERGLTAIIDIETDIMGWMGLAGTRDFLNVAADYVDFAKFQAHHCLSLPHDYVRKKIQLYREFDVQPFAGGILFELAHQNGAVGELITHFKRIGMPALEISENYITLERDERRRQFERFKAEGFDIIYEYGRKRAETPLSIPYLETIVQDCLNMGIDHIIIEEDEINIMAEKAPETLVELRKQPWMSKLFFEPDPFSFPKQHVRMLEQFGTDLNMCNIAPGQVVRLEDYRLGMARPVNFKFLADQVGGASR